VTVSATSGMISIIVWSDAAASTDNSQANHSTSDEMIQSNNTNKLLI